MGFFVPTVCPSYKGEGVGKVPSPLTQKLGIVVRPQPVAECVTSRSSLADKSFGSAYQPRSARG